MEIIQVFYTAINNVSGDAAVCDVIAQRQIYVANCYAIFGKCKASPHFVTQTSQLSSVGTNWFSNMPITQFTFFKCQAQGHNGLVTSGTIIFCVFGPPNRPPMADIGRKSIGHVKYQYLQFFVPQEDKPLR